MKIDSGPPIRFATQTDGQRYEFPKPSIINWQELIIPDPASESDTDLRGEQLRRRISDFSRQLRDNPDWPAVRMNEEKNGFITKNPVSEAIYSSHGMTEWRKLVPSAFALFNLQKPDEKLLVGSDLELDLAARDYFNFALDSMAIRTRAKIVERIVADTIRPNEPNTWVSLASGAAVPVLEAIQNGAAESASMLDVHLVDFDLRALDFFDVLKDKIYDVDSANFHKHPANLYEVLVDPTKLVAQIGEGSVDMVDAVGIFEYMREDRAARFLKNAYLLVKPGGSLVISNMLNTHPELDFNQRGIGWEDIYPRSKEGLRSIIETADISTSDAHGFQAQDGVYGVIKIEKPLEVV